MSVPISSKAYFKEYSGHPISDLHALLPHLPSPRLYLAGDSTLDNKYWLSPPSYPTPSPYTSLFSPPLSQRDLCYWLCNLCSTHTPVNTAVEASSLRSRQAGLLPHDILIRDNLTPDDVLVVSVGGNDIALVPSVTTIFGVLTAVYLGGRWGESALRKLFVQGVQAYVQKLVEKCKPRLVVICGLYFMDEANKPSWAGRVLKILDYNKKPERVQRVIRTVTDMMKEIEIEHVNTVVADFSEVLDGKCSDDYVARVEPSEEGGRKMAAYLTDLIQTQLASIGRAQN